MDMTDPPTVLKGTAEDLDAERFLTRNTHVYRFLLRIFGMTWQ